MDLYDDVYGKLALTLTATQVAKQQIVDVNGIGEDLPFCLTGWQDGVLLSMMALGPETMALPVPQRLPLVSASAQVLRAVFGCDSITFVAEGFISRNAQTRGRDLRRAFVDATKDVNECVTVCHVEINRFGEPDATIMSVPYGYVNGRNVVWGDACFYEHGVGKVLRDAPIIAAIAIELAGEIIDLDEESAMETLSALDQEGVNIEIFAKPPWMD